MSNVPRPKFTLRAAAPSDVPRLASIAAAALLDDGFYAVLHPRRHEFYDDYQRAFQRKLQRAVLTDTVHLVAETDAPTTTTTTGEKKQKKEIVGWAAWHRMGNSPEAARTRSQNHSLLKRLEHTLLTLTSPCALAPADRSADAAALSQLAASHPSFLAATFDAEHWHLQMCVVDPRWQRNGVGQMLVRWGLDRARCEGVGAGLEASDPGAPMYLRMGFVEIGRFHTPREGLHYPALAWRPPTPGEGEGEGAGM